jgi:hypothetical protein
MLQSNQYGPIASIIKAATIVDMCALIFFVQSDILSDAADIDAGYCKCTSGMHQRSNLVVVNTARLNMCLRCTHLESFDDLVHSSK